MNNFSFISKLLILGAISIAVVVVGVMRGLDGHDGSGVSEADPQLVAPGEDWSATSTLPGYGADDRDDFKVRALPTLPANEYEISSLPAEEYEISSLPAEEYKISSLPAEEYEISSLPQEEFEISTLPAPTAPAFEPLPTLDDQEAPYQIEQLPVMEASAEANGEPELAPRALDESNGQSGFGIRISNLQSRDFDWSSAVDNVATNDNVAKSSEQGSDFEISNFSHAKNSEFGFAKNSFYQNGRQQDKSSQVESSPARFELAEFSQASEPIEFMKRLPAKPLQQQSFSDVDIEQQGSSQVVTASADLDLASILDPSLEKFAGARFAALPTPLAAAIVAADKKKKKKKAVVAAPKKGEKKPPKKASAENDFKLAAQPKFGDHYIADSPQVDNAAHLLEPSFSDFSSDALNPYLPYDPQTQADVYQGKQLNANQRPLVELGRPWYQLGQLSPGSSVLGFHNNVTPQFLIYGDARVAYASNRSNGDSQSLIATQLNLDFDLKLTGTERFHAFISPTGSGQNSRYLLDEDRFVFEGDADIDFGYFEGDLGAIVGGAIGQTLPFDLPFTVGIIPLVFQNGVWFEDAILGVAATLPARNSPRLNISNMDITFFAGYDKLNSDAFPGDDSAARIVGVASFIEALNGYFEVDYAFLDDRTFDDRSYHNIGIGYTRRYGRFLSNSTRVIVNAGQSADVVENTADGVLLLSENSLITGHPSNIVPYFNMFAGFDRPQSAARANASGGVLRNTGILFESDNLTGYPTLDATANNTYGFAAGINILSSEFSQQLVLEAAALGVMGDAASRRAQGDQYGVGFRYQLPLSNSVIFRADGMVGFLRNDEDISGIRLEVRRKF